MPYAVDLFCGAGGFSEGILQAGFNIIFSSDKSSMVKETYINRHKQLGIIEGRDTHFELIDVKDLSAQKIFDEVNKLKYGNIFKKGNIDAFFGGPPCQGFSRLGKRDSSDPRNMLFHEYLRLIKGVRPKYVVLENVTGILDMYMLDFPSVLNNSKYLGQNLVKDILKRELEGLNYNLLNVQVLNAADFGVPQRRNRVVFLAYRKDVTPLKYPKPAHNKVSVYDALGDLYSDNPYSTEYSKESIVGRTPNYKTGIPIRREKITNMELPHHDIVVQERFSLYEEGENKKGALSRLRISGIDLMKNTPALFWSSLFNLNEQVIADELKKILQKENFKNIDHIFKNFTFINKLLANIALADEKHQKREYDFQLNKLAKRLQINLERTKSIWKKLSKAIQIEKISISYNQKMKEGKINDTEGESLFTKKGIRSRLDPKSVAPTMVTLPDDFIHPYYDRILTVREMARLQSFDDSFEFIGKRTTGGIKRKQEIPQYTQVGNAVPPLLAKKIAQEVLNAIKNNDM